RRAVRGDADESQCDLGWSGYRFVAEHREIARDVQRGDAAAELVEHTSSNCVDMLFRAERDEVHAADVADEALRSIEVAPGLHEAIRQRADDFIAAAVAVTVVVGAEMVDVNVQECEGP